MKKNCGSCIGLCALAEADGTLVGLDGEEGPAPALVLDVNVQLEHGRRHPEVALVAVGHVVRSAHRSGIGHLAPGKNIIPRALKLVPELLSWPF